MIKVLKGSTAVLVIGLVVVLTGGCGSGSSDQQAGKLPEDSSEVSYTVPATTKYVSTENEASVVAVEDDGATIVLDADSDLATGVVEGDVLMFGITSQTPNGLLRKVKSKSSAAEGVVVETSAATLPEAFEELDLKLVRSLPYEEMDSYDTTLQGLEIRRYPLTLEGDATGKFEVGFDGTVLYDEDGNKSTTDDQVVADGSISFSVGVTLEAKIEWFSLKRLKVGAAVSQDGDLTVKTTLAGLKFKKEVVLGKMYFAPFMVGPVVVTPKLELVLGATGDLKVQVVTSVSEHVGAEAGAVYENGKWTPYSNITSDWDFQPPTLTASAQVKAYVGPRFSLMLYGVAGPHAQVVAYLDLSADVSKTPWWELYAGIEGSLGIEGEILGYELFKFQLEGIVDFRKLLAQAEGAVECEPDCSGLECGPDPVCGESCETCGGGESCQAGKCVQGGPICPEDKDCSGLECGPDPVCEESCGTCGGGESCQGGQCVEVVYGDTWKDPTSGLTWQVTPTGGTMNWSEAKTHCQNLSLDGSGWRLPDIGELRSLIRGCPATEDGGSCNVEEGDCLAWSCRDDSCKGCSYFDGPGNDGMYWPDEVEGGCCNYWSSSPVEDYDDGAWGVGFNDGYVDGGSDSDDGHVRCVR